MVEYSESCECDVCSEIRHLRDVECQLSALASMVDAAGLADRPQSETGETDFQRIASAIDRACGYAMRVAELERAQYIARYAWGIAKAATRDFVAGNKIADNTNDLACHLIHEQQKRIAELEASNDAK